MKPQKLSKITKKAATIKHVNKKRLLKTFGLLLGLLLVAALGLFLIQQYNSTYPAEGIAGKAYSDLTAEQKQGYWTCYKEKGCGALLGEAQQSKNYAAYRTCSKECHAQALAQKQEDFYCTDSDGINYTNRGIVTSNFYPTGKEDYCLDINGKNYLFEGKCVNNKAQFVQKGCGEMGNYGCEGGKCIGNYGDGTYVLKEGDKVSLNNGVKVEIVNISNTFISYKLNLNFYIGENKINPIPVPIETIMKLPKNKTISNVDYVDYAIKISPNGDDFFADGEHYVNLTITSVEQEKLSSCVDLYNLCITKYGKSKYGCMKYCPYEPGKDEIKLQEDQYLVLAPITQEENAKNLLPEMEECSQAVSQEIGIEPFFKLTPLRMDENDDVNTVVTNVNGIYWPIKKNSIKYNFSLDECENLVLLHELTHYAISPAPLNDIFNEGFAVYLVENYKLENDPMGILCLEGGWTTNNKHPLDTTKEKYVNPDGTGKYMDLTKYLKSGYPYQESWIYFYNTAYCFWNELEKEYSPDVFLTIMEKIKEYRTSGETLCLDKELKSLIGEEEYLQLALKFYPSDIPPSDIPVDDESEGILLMPSPSITCKNNEPIIMTGDQWT